MSMELAALSFFKQNKLRYVWDKPNIFFSCFHCFQEATMWAANTKWRCTSCEEEGTLIHLINMAGHGQKPGQEHGVYDPRKERGKINAAFRTLSEKYGDEMISLQQRVETLIQHLIDIRREHHCNSISKKS